MITVKNNKSNKGKSGTKLAPSATSGSYQGPTRLPKGFGQNDLMTTQINNQGTMQTSSSGLLNTVFDWYAQASSSGDWSSFLALYTEYRVLSMEVEFIPWNKYNQALAPTVNLAPMYSVVDRTSSAPLTTAASAIDYESMEVHEPSERFRRSVKMNSLEEAQWIAASSVPGTGARCYIKLYSSGNANSLNVYDFVCRTIVQFRGRQ